jgi:ketosteroid isomerase-like protein
LNGLSRLTLILTLALVPGMIALAQPASLSRASLQQWLDGYGAAWRARDAQAAGALFTENASYRETPYAEPFQGRTGIAQYWATVTADQRDVRFEAHIIAVDGNTGIAEWSATFANAASGDVVGLDGVFVLEFDASGLCSSLREWWFLRPTPE